MPTGLVQLAIPAWQIVVRTVAIYLAFLLGLRIFGKREIGQFTLYDLVVILLIANALQPAMTGPDTSLAGGLLIIGTLLIVNYGVSWLQGIPGFLRIFEGEPTIIARDGEFLLGPMRRQGIQVEEATMALREHGVQNVKEVKLMVLEPDGTISVVPADARVLRGRRRVRYLRQR